MFGYRILGMFYLNLTELLELTKANDCYWSVYIIRFICVDFASVGICKMTVTVWSDLMIGGII